MSTIEKKPVPAEGSWSIETRGEEQTRRLGRLLGAILPEKALILLTGTLGAGKTVFSQGVARGMGFSESTAIASPTYTLLNHYRGEVDLYHFDLYRLGDPDELFELGFDEFAHGEGICLVEWSERLDDRTFSHLAVAIERLSAEDRRIEFSAQGSEYVPVLQQLNKDWTASCR